MNINYKENDFGKCIQALISSSCVQSSIDATWVYARRDALKALSSLFKKKLIQDAQIPSENNNQEESIEIDLVKATIECYLNALGDYTLDSKGDTGCYVREAGLEAIESLVDLLLVPIPSVSQVLLANPYLVVRIFAGLVQQAVERIDRTRALAGRVFSRLLHSQNVINADNSVVVAGLRQLFPKQTCETLDWHADHATLPAFIRLLRPEYYGGFGGEFQDAVLVGFAYSIGSLTGSLRKCATSSLMRELKSIEKDDLDSLRVIINKLLGLCRLNLKNNRRLSSSLIRTVDLVVQNGLLKSMPDMPDLFVEVFTDALTTTKVNFLFFIFENPYIK